MYPQSQVLGVDLSPVQPGFVPPNLLFQIDDIEEPWTYGQKFDFIYSRMMVGSLANVPRFFEQSFENLAPGGVLEMADIAYPAKLNGGDIPEDSQLYKWCQSFSVPLLFTPLNCFRSHHQRHETLTVLLPGQSSSPKPAPKPAATPTAHDCTRPKWRQQASLMS